MVPFTSLTFRQALPRVAALVLSALLLSSAAAQTGRSVGQAATPAATTTSTQEELVRINMNNADIRTVIKWVAEQTQKNIIIDPRVKGKLSVLSSSAMTMDDAYQVFLAALDVYGFAVVESGNNLKILPNAQARSSGLPLVESFAQSDQSNADFVMNVIKVDNISANEVVTILRPLVPQTGHLAALPSSNSVIIADRINNITRLANLIRHIDQSGNLDIEVIKLEHATAADVIKVMNPLLGKNKSGSGVSFASDKRSNSILMTGTDEKRADVRQLIDSLDRPLQGNGNTTVVYLNYIDAEEVKGIIDGMTGSIAGEEASVKVNKDNISIEISETTNALVITAPPSVLETIERVIAELDVRRSQVMIDAVIVEVSDSFTDTLEVLWATDNVQGGVDSGAISSANLTSNTTTAALLSESQEVAFLQAGINWGFYRNGTLRGLIRALETDSRSNVLSRPSIITLDNEEAEVLVGSNVPFITGSQVSSSSDVNNPFQTIERKDIGVTLKVTPKINKQNTITLEIEQEVESVREERLSSASDIITDKRSIKTQVLIQNEDILVLGGLIDERVTHSESKVPILGDIPLLGRFFRSSSDTIRKQNLMVFIRPTILDELDDIYNESEKRYNQIKDKQGQKKSKRIILPDFEELRDNALAEPAQTSEQQTSKEPVAEEDHPVQ
jgi:general secretion pathway protein D